MCAGSGLVQADARKASERGRDQRNALRQRPMNRPLVSKAKPASIIMSREANIVCVLFWVPKKTKNVRKPTHERAHKLRNCVIIRSKFRADAPAKSTGRQGGGDGRGRRV